MELTDAAFETEEHPYKENLVQFPGQEVRNLLVEKQMEEIEKERLVKEKEWVKEVVI